MSRCTRLPVAKDKACFKEALELFWKSRALDATFRTETKNL